jgi:hypothetical protein
MFVWEDTAEPALTGEERMTFQEDRDHCETFYLESKFGTLQKEASIIDLHLVVSEDEEDKKRCCLIHVPHLFAESFMYYNHHSARFAEVEETSPQQLRLSIRHYHSGLSKEQLKTLKALQAGRQASAFLLIHRAADSNIIKKAMAAAEAASLTAEFTDLTDDDVKLEGPFRMQITGSSHSGKSTFLLHLVKYREEVLKERYGRIIYCYPSDDESQHAKNNVEALQREFEGLEIVRGLPDLDMCKTGDHCLLLLDDLATEIFESSAMKKLFTRDSHHELISVAFTTQNFYTKAKNGREIPICITHHVIYKMAGEVQSLQAISRKITGSSVALTKMFRFISEKFPIRGVSNYLLINLHQKCVQPETLAFRTEIFPRMGPFGSMETMPVFLYVD